MTRTPVRVTIVRPPKTYAQHTRALVVSVGVVFLRAWLVMLLVPVAWPPLTLGYWQAVAVVLLAGFLVKSTFGYGWTESGDQKAPKATS